MAFSRMNRLVDCFSRVTRVRLLRYSNSSSTMSDEERTELEAKQQIENYSDEEKKKLESLEIDYWMRKRKCDWRVSFYAPDIQKMMEGHIVFTLVHMYVCVCVCMYVCMCGPQWLGCTSDC